MSCEDKHEVVSEYVDLTLDPEARRRFEGHLEGCEECRSLVRDLARIRDAASSLATPKPPGRVWAGIAREIAAEQEAMSTAARARSGRRAFSWLEQWTLGPLPALAAAVLVLAAIAGYVYWPTRAPAAETAVHPGADELVQSVRNDLELAEKHYENAIAGLEKIRESGRGTLDPQVAETLDLNLAVIDKAIADSRAALASQPGSQLARDTLFEAFRRKVSLLQDTIALINEMRKGNQAGAARIVGGLDKS
ncbi:MAG: anti-sigma factor [Vicinamibacterales bacterium]